MKVAVKICGITRLTDAELACDLGAWALGFIFYPKSPRYVAPEKVRSIIEALAHAKRGPTKTVGVCVNNSPEEVRRIVKESGVSTVQLAGDESPDYVAALKDLDLIKTIRLEKEEDIPPIRSYESWVSGLLFDAVSGQQYGGSGRTADWMLVHKVPRNVPLILAGGIHASNLAQALETVAPDGIDLSSGVETAPGIKDSRKLEIFFRRLEELHGKYS